MEIQPTGSARDTKGNDEGRLAVIYRMAVAGAGTLDLPHVLRSTVESVAKLLGADVVTLYLYDQAKETFIPPPVAVGVSPACQLEMPRQQGSAAKIAKLGKPMIANRAAEHPDISQEFLTAEQIVSSAGFPLQVDDATVGVLFLNYHDYHEFTPDDIEKITLFTRLAAIAVRNAELLRQQEATTKRLQVLQQAQKAIDSAAGLEEVLEQILIEGLRIVDTERGTLMLIEGDDLVTKAQFGPEKDLPEHTTLTFRVGEGIAGRVAGTGEAFLSPDVLLDPSFKKPPNGKELRFRSLLAVPITSREGQVIGVINADDPQAGHFDETHKQLLSDMAGQFAAALERMMLVDTLHALHRISERLTSVAITEGELSPVLNEIAKNAVEILRIDVVTIYQYDQSRSKFIVPPLMRGISENQRMQTEVLEGEAPWVMVHEFKRNHYAPDALNDRVMNPSRPSGRGPGFVMREGIRSAAGLLLKVRDDIVGVMFVNYRSPHLFLEREKQILETFANSAAIAIQDARKWESLKTAQEELIKTARLSAMGGLAGGIAHELKNPLGIILTSVNVLESGILDEDEIPLKLQEIKSQVHRARAIIDSILNFVRSPETGRGTVDVLALLNETLHLLNNQVKLNHIQVEAELMPVPHIQGNAATLKQVFLNILTNAIEAMPVGGRLKVGTAVENDRVYVEIEDTGVGKPSEIQHRIFEPLFTTKAATHGAGLGLAVSYRILADHRGDIQVHSEVGKGSTFVVSLPLGDAV